LQADDVLRGEGLWVIRGCEVAGGEPTAALYVFT
jgi:hypothetical protein